VEAGTERARHALPLSLPMIWKFVLANLTIVMLSVGLSLRPGLPPGTILIFAASMLLLGNGLVWLGVRSRQTDRNGRLGVRPLFCFAGAGLAAVDTIMEIANNGFVSAERPLSCGIILLILGVVAMRNKAMRNKIGPSKGSP
jgi:hypothetical protein